MEEPEATPLSTREEALLLTMVAFENRFDFALPIHWLAQYCSMPHKECNALLEDLARRNWVVVRRSGPGKSLGDTAAFTPGGKKEARGLAVVAPRGPGAELRSVLPPLHRAMLDAVVDHQLRHLGSGPIKSHVRTSTRAAVASDVSTEELNAGLDALVPLFLQRQGGPEDSYLVELAGLVSSSWGANAIDLADHAMNAIRSSDSSDPQYSWSAICSSGVSPRDFELARLVLPLVGLGKGPYDHTSDWWWSMPPERDVVLLKGPATQLIRSLVDASREAIERAAATARDVASRSQAGTSSSSRSAAGGSAEQAQGAALPRGSRKAQGNMQTATKSILFMDVSGWSGLSAAQIHDYVTKAMPGLAPLLTEAAFLNTWGDAIVATFDSAKEAAEAALRVQDFFRKSYPEQGVPSGLLCRVALHVAEAIIDHNAITKRDDIFGHGVHVAARLEPVTEPGYVFCTKSFADLLLQVRGAAPKPWLFEIIKLPKGFGELEASVVTWPNDPDPRPSIRTARARDEPANVPHAAPPQALEVSDADALMLLESWVNGLTVDRSGQSIPFATVASEASVSIAVAKRLLGQAASRCERWSVRLGDAFVQVTVSSSFLVPSIVSDPPRGY